MVEILQPAAVLLARGLVPDRTSTAARDTCALAMPVIALVMPGPAVTRATRVHRHLVMGLRHVDGGPLVAHVDDLNALRVEAHPDRHDVAATEGKDALDAPGLEGPGDDGRNAVGRDLHGVSFDRQVGRFGARRGAHPGWIDGLRGSNITSNSKSAFR